MKHFSGPLIAASLAVGLFAPATFAASPAAPAAAAVPRVVFIVGPSGPATAAYKAEARTAAKVARKYTPDVVELYSPDATWPAVKRALDGASLVVYMGHGNGWPSRYRDSLYPASQNGFGLNPKAGGNDATHQYFGEAAIAAEVKLAKNAVVLLHHLCYASGLSEPGLAEGTLDQAQQRVDNFAAGFIGAGAAAVVAEAYASPTYLVRSVLAGSRSIESSWAKAPSANGHRLVFASERSPGFVAEMDTKTATSGFSRSIVLRSGLAPRDMLASAQGSAAAASLGPIGPPAEPSLTGTGVKLGAPDVADLTSAGASVELAIPFKLPKGKALPKGLQASARWDPIDVAVVPADPASEVEPGAESAPGSDAEATTPGAGSPRRPSVDAGTPDAAPAEPAPIEIAAPEGGVDLVVAERVGDVVAPVAIKVDKKAMRVPVALPDAPGRYRLTITLHDAEGVAYDAATQALVSPLSVRVTGDFDGAIVAAATAELTAGTEASLAVKVANLGLVAWGHGPITSAEPDGDDPAEAATVIGRWIPLSSGAVLPIDEAARESRAHLPIGLAPGVTVDASLALTVPSVPGQYLLLLDVVTPERGSLVASGLEPALVRVTVLPAP